MEENKPKKPSWYDDWENYMRTEDTRPSHKFIIEKAREFPPGTPHGLNSLPYVLMPAVAFAMEEYAQSQVAELKYRADKFEASSEQYKENWTSAVDKVSELQKELLDQKLSYEKTYNDQCVRIDKLNEEIDGLKKEMEGLIEIHQLQNKESNETKTNNELIAQFIGIKYSPVGCTQYDGKRRLINVDELEYDERWDWLMPVVEKIETLGFFFIIKSTYVEVNRLYDPVTVSCADGESKIQAVYKVVIEFIKWYNAQKLKADSSTTQTA